MADYSQQSWTDGVTSANAVRMSHIEAGIAAAIGPNTVLKTGSTWGPRPTSRADVTVFWIGAPPAPPATGSGAAMAGVDIYIPDLT